MAKEISYGIIPVRDERLLLLRVYNTYDFPKGKPDDGETPLQTAIRELQEESSLSDPQFLWGLEFVETLPYKKGKKTARYFIAACPTGDVAILPNPESGIVEHHSFAWVSVQEARSLLKDRHTPVLDWIEKRLNKDGTYDPNTSE